MQFTLTTRVHLHLQIEKKNYQEFIKVILIV